MQNTRGCQTHRLSARPQKVTGMAPSKGTPASTALKNTGSLVIVSA